MGLVVFSAVSNAQNDMMYVIKNGLVVNKQSVRKTDFDSIIFYPPKPTPSNTFIDLRDGNFYETTTIGTQVWMAENLKYLPSVALPGNASIFALYYVYGYNGEVVADAKATVNYNTYGVLYNWSAANPKGSQGVCPSGWHLPSDAEWTTLSDFLLGKSINETGFAPLLAGFNNGKGYEMGETAYWWTATSSTGSNSNAFVRVMDSKKTDFTSIEGTKKAGFSIRCVKD